MIYDPKLEEAVARAIARQVCAGTEDILDWVPWVPCARAALSAIDGSGTHIVTHVKSGE